MLVAIPLVADTKQKRKVSRETKKEKERQEKTAKNEHDVRSIKIGLYIVVVVVVVFWFFSSMCVLRSSDKQFSWYQFGAVVSCEICVRIAREKR